VGQAWREAAARWRGGGTLHHNRVTRASRPPPESPRAALARDLWLYTPAPLQPMVMTGGASANGGCCTWPSLGPAMMALTGEHEQEEEA
jgi:hypothetical protein